MGTLLLSRWRWSVHLSRGRPGGCFHVGSGGQPTDSSTWRSMAWCVGMLSGNLATCPNMALWPLAIRSDTGARPVREETSRTKSCHLIPRILRWQKKNLPHDVNYLEHCHLDVTCGSWSHWTYTSADNAVHEWVSLQQLRLKHSTVHWFMMMFWLYDVALSSLVVYHIM